MKRVYLLTLIILISLSAAAQFESNTQSMPVLPFRSTSTMVSSGSTYGSNYRLDSNGKATFDSPFSGPRRAKMDAEDDEIIIYTPGQGGSQAPIGDAVLPLLLMLMAYAGYIAHRRHKQCA